MMQTFYKYHGTGNDFILIDNRMGTFKPDAAIISKLCTPKFGIGADGLILINEEPGYDFRMVLYNADGYEGSMCGNGGRCAVAFAHFLGIGGEKLRFMAWDGSHEAQLLSYSERESLVRLGMRDVKDFKRGKGYILMDTGSPHIVYLVAHIDAIKVEKEGRKIRYSKRFAQDGINVDFAANVGDRLQVRTYERGVEAETLSCGTGVTASVLSFAILLGLEQGPLSAETRGGELKVYFNKRDGEFTDIFLEGPATLAFTGSFPI